ncbi:hypothetical protein F5Y19DRAFT_276449 [Xylariaceae sp. FL1651]|nr:hypothetical protein F5Y19DRAFT_276449 [Xylariaceae sp. FL1651]
MMAENSQASRQIYQVPDWETSTARTPKATILARLFRSKHVNAGASAATRPEERDTSANGAFKETSAHSLALPTHAPVPPNVNSGLNRQVLVGPIRSGFDSVIPPHRSYFGRSRRFFLFYVLLPLVIFILVILPLAVGLGVGLSRRSDGSHKLPLPSNRDSFTGDLTYYEPALGACGVQSSSTDAICAISRKVFDAARSSSDPNRNPLCGLKIRVQRDFVESDAGNRSVDVTVVDRCVGCALYDLDLSLAVFTQLAPQDSGRVVGSWSWLD